jgi:hypothetical protein
MKHLHKILFFFFLSLSVYAQDLKDLTNYSSGSVQEVLENFSQLENYYSVHHDRRKLFVKIYSHITYGIEDMISSRQVIHGAWLEDLIIGFSDEYRKAVWAYESNQMNQVTLAWRYDFDQSRAAQIGRATQLLLSLNSHILFDLPLTISKNMNSSIGLNKYKEDYFKLNQMFKNLIPQLFAILYREENFKNTWNNHPAELLKKEIVGQLVVQMRKAAWKRSLFLADIRDAKMRNSYIKQIEIQTVQLSKLVVSLDPFLSTIPGQIVPEHLRENTLKTLKSIYLLLDPHASLDNLVKF